MRSNLRIPIFDKEFLFNIRNEINIEKDEPDFRWIDSEWKPEIKSKYIGGQYDSIAEREVFRLLKFKTCPYCKSTMEELKPMFDLGVVYVCKLCFYWGGRGSRPGGPQNNRGNLGRLNFVSNPDDVKLELLLNHLNENIERIYNLTPRQAEKIIPIILSDYINCEVKSIGGTKDGGIDALAILSEKEKMLVQIKWREKANSSEAVSVVREVGGTLLARKIPKALIISTRNKFSKTAINEALEISENEIIGLGKLNITLNDFNDLIDMFNISTKVRNEKIDLEEIIPEYNGGFDLFGQP